MRLSRYWPRLFAVAAVATAATAGAGALAGAPARAAPAGCAVSYSIGSQWAGGFSAGIVITNTGDPLTSWTLTWSFTAGQQITQGWSATYSQTGTEVTAVNASWNGAVATGGSVTAGFNGSWNNASNPVPASFSLNGTACTGGSPGPTPTSPSPSPTSPSPSPTSPGPSPSQSGTGSLPSSFQWHSSGILISPTSDAAHNLVAVKDPSVVFFNGAWQVFVSTVNTAGSYSMGYLTFTDWSQASSATLHYLDQTAIGSGYRAAPEVFYFAPQKLWYLVYQTGSNASYSTNSDITNPSGWSAPKNFYASEPAIVQQNIGSGFWVDMWVICDSANCYLFSSDDNGHLYRSQTTVANFPNGFSDPVIAMQDTSNKFNLYEASNVYKVSGANQYLLLVEAIGSDGHRYFRSWTSPSINGQWAPLAATESNPFARSSNVTMDGSAWTHDISHGEMIRSGFDQTLTISPCKLQYLYQGVDPSSANLPYNSLPWRLGLLTQTNSAC
jgi:endo-1,4-beta-xylanase